MTTNSQLPMTEPKKQKQKQAKQTTRTGTERTTDIEITWRVFSREVEAGEWRKRYRE